MGHGGRLGLGWVLGGGGRVLRYCGMGGAAGGVGQWS